MRRREQTDKTFFEGNVDLPQLAASLNKIFKTVEKDGLGQETFTELEKEIQTVSSKLGVSKKAAILLGYIVEHSATNGSDDDDLANYVGCSNIEFIGFRSALEELDNHGVITHIQRGPAHRLCYYVTREALKTIEKDAEFIPFPMTGLSADELFTRFRIFFSDFQKDVIDAERLLANIHQVLKGNPDLEFSKKVLDSPLMTECCDTEERFFFYLCHRMVSFGDNSVPIERLLRFTDYMEDDQLIRRSLSNERSTLQKSGLVCFGGEDGFQDMDSLALSDDVITSFFNEVTLERKSEQQHKDLISSSSIAAKELYYNEKEAEQMERLASLLSPQNFKGVQQRLKDMGMRKGFAVLFSGGAGCGKTAGAYELARRTGRDIFAVDMSQLKSKWVGDSEKIVKGVFETYKNMCRKRENAPILLFNEADAIFSKRIENPEDSVDQMMNAIQNICLEAIENLDGILIATTNLAANFCDDAFARRFIFKVEFSTPEAETRAKIWKSMIQDITDDDACELGKSYTFSGGNIENIARKAAVGYVLSGEKASLAELRKYCDEETLSGRSKRARIGF